MGKEEERGFLSQLLRTWKESPAILSNASARCQVLHSSPCLPGCCRALWSLLLHLSASVFCPVFLEGSSLVEINTPRESSPEFIISGPGISLENARGVYLTSKQKKKGGEAVENLLPPTSSSFFCGQSFKCEGALTQKKEQSNVLKSTAFHLQKVLFSTCLWNLSQMF